MGRGLRVIGTQTWRLTDLGSKHMLLKEGIGRGYMAEHTVPRMSKRGRSSGSINLSRQEAPNEMRGSAMRSVYFSATGLGVIART
jgi:hypothetical protein